MVAILQFLPLYHDASQVDAVFNFAFSEPLVTSVLWLVFSTLLLIGSLSFAGKAGRTRWAIFVLVLVGLCVTSSLLFWQGVSLPASLAALLFLFSYTVLLFLWGVRFALLDTEDAGFTVLCTASLAFVGVFAVLQLPPDAQYFIKIIAVAASALFFLKENGNVNSWQTVQSGLKLDTLLRVGPSFYASRVLLGIGIGLCGICLRAITQDVKTLTPLESALTVSALAAVLLLLQHKRIAPPRILPLLPIAAVFFTTIVFLPSGMIAVILSTSTVAWFSWIALSSLQLSKIREEKVTDVIRLACIEKLLIICPVCVLSGLQRSGLLSAFADHAAYVTWLPLLVMSLSVLGVVFSLVGISIPPVEQNDGSLENYDAACETIAKRFSLSAREQEVMSYLGKGYTRGAISRKLHIAENTTRTHVGHIHDKMQIHRNDELIDIIHNEIAP
jgi:DNA-binding CsgD family transcriptional regulator